MLYSGSFALYVSVAAGTVVGLVIKYILDKLFVFRHRSKRLSENLSLFTLYAMTGLVTTAIFWGFEFGFIYLFETKLARYIGALIGLTIGFIVKYRLDSYFVFERSKA